MTKIYPYDLETLSEMLAEAAAVEAAVREAVREALLMHKRLGNPVVTWVDGRVVWVPPDQIPVDDTQMTHLEQQLPIFGEDKGANGFASWRLCVRLFGKGSGARSQRRPHAKAPRREDGYASVPGHR